jgi:hypothetical protein
MKEELFRQGLAVALVDLEHEPELMFCRRYTAHQAPLRLRTESAISRNRKEAPADQHLTSGDSAVRVHGRELQPRQAVLCAR